VLDDMVAAIEAMGMTVNQYHPESATGQYEVVLRHAPALEAADQLLLAREAVCGVARRHGLAASFLPKPYPNQAGSGCHCHFSLVKVGGAAGCSDGGCWTTFGPSFLSVFWAGGGFPERL
jgi:glutamine synthetase